MGGVIFDSLGKYDFQIRTREREDGTLINVYRKVLSSQIIKRIERTSKNTDRSNLQ